MIHFSLTYRAPTCHLSPRIGWNLDIGERSGVSKSRTRALPAALKRRVHRSSNHRALITEKFCRLLCFALSRVPPHYSFPVPRAPRFVSATKSQETDRPWAAQKKAPPRNRPSSMCFGTASKGSSLSSRLRFFNCFTESRRTSLSP